MQTILWTSHFSARTLRCALGIAALTLASCSGDVGSSGDRSVGPRRDAAAPDDPDAGVPPPAADGAADRGAPAPLVAPTADDLARFEQLLDHARAQLTAQGVPGAAVAVVLPGKQALTAGLGVKERGGSDPVTADTLFSLASVSKVFTAATAIAMNEAGLLAPADPVVQQIPKLKLSDPSQVSAITVHQLLVHTAGIGYPKYEAYAGAQVDWGSPEVIVQLFETVTWPLWSPPGRVWNYSNKGYNLAAAVIQRAAAKPFHEALREHLLAPAQMKSSTASAAEVLARDHASGHQGDEVIPAGDYTSALPDVGCNGVYSSAADMARFARLLLTGGGGALAPASVAEIIEPQHAMDHISDEQAYGYGLFVDTYGSARIVYHGGTNVGFTADLILLPDVGVGVAVLMSSGLGDPQQVSAKALDLFAGEFMAALPAPQAFSPMTAEQLARLAGRYHDPHELGTVDFSVANGTLRATFERWGHQSALTQIGQREFSFSMSSQMASGLELDGWSSFSGAFYLDAADRGELFATLTGTAVRQ